jgi:hypothetical protein
VRCAARPVWIQLFWICPQNAQNERREKKFSFKLDEVAWSIVASSTMKAHNIQDIVLIFATSKRACKAWGRQALVGSGLLGMILLTGCASTDVARVTTTRDSSFTLTKASKIAMAGRGQDNSSETDLGQTLTTELRNAGFQIVPQSEAEFILAYWVEDSWAQIKTTDYSATQLPLEQRMPPPNCRTAVFDPPVTPAPRSVTTSVGKKGIRLRLYPSANTSTNRFITVWDGYIDTGFKLSSDQSKLLRTLLEHFGQDYNGSVKISRQL